MELRKEVNVEQLINRFTEMANRDALLMGEHITQADFSYRLLALLQAKQ